MEFYSLNSIDSQRKKRTGKRKRKSLVYIHWIRYFSMFGRNYLDEDQKGLEVGSGVKHKACVLRKPLDISFVTRVDEDWS